MKSGVPWHVKGVGQEAREAAQEAARRAGMSVGEWLDTVIAGAAHEEGHAEPARSPRAEPDHDDGEHDESRDDDRSERPAPGRRRYSDYDERQRAASTDELAQVTGRIDSLTRVIDERSGQPGRLDEVSSRLKTLNRQIEQLARAQATPSYHASPAERAPEASHKLADVISRLDRRLDAMVEQGRTADTEIRKGVGEVDRAVAGLGQERQDRPLPPGADLATPLDQALVEIAERQRALDGEGPAHSELPRAPTQEFSTLEAQLRKLNSRIDGLRPCGIDSAVETLRDDLAEIGLMMKEAMPRRAIEALENEVRSLATRIDTQRHAGVDGQALAGLERGLAEVRDALRALTPAENLVGLDESMRSLTQRIESVAAGQSDPAALQQLESAIVGLRGVVSHVASNEALANLSDEVRSLSTKVDQVTGGDVLSTLDHRIATIADALQSRHQQNGQEARDLEVVVERLTGKLEQMQLSRADHAAVIHLEDRIARLVEKLDTSDARLVHLEAIERGLAELLIHIEHQRVPNLTPGGAPAAGDDALKRDVQRTQDSLEAVHGTLGHLVDRLAMIETGMRGEALPKVVNIPVNIPENIPEPPAEEPPSPPEPPPRRTPAVPPIRAAAPAAAVGVAEVDDAPAAPIPNPAPVTERDHRPIDPNLPPDTPLEPGITRGRSNASPAERIAASEAALGPAKPPVIPDPGGKTNFIAAARRAAQAATSELGARPDKRATVTNFAATAKPAGRWNKRVRQLLVATSVLAIVLGSLQIAANLFSSADAPETEPAQSPAPGAASPSSVPTGITQAPAPTATPTIAQPATTPAASPPAAPVAPARAPAGRQSLFFPNGNTIPFATPSFGIVIPPAPARQRAEAQRPETSRAIEDADPIATGSVQQPQAAHAPAVPIPPLPLARPNTAERPVGADKLPAAIGSGGLRAAAIKGDAGAEYEIALRYADGHGVPKNLTAAAEWFERAAKQGLVQAQFRLGGHYEKGLGVNKDIEAARGLYTEAAEAGNAKAMHNLAVLYAEGVAGKPDYQTAARWFRKAADYGLADSQYNLGILYARGIGVEANLAEAYKWFTLAARDGDKEAAKKRDDVGARLNQQSLMAARAAVQVWAAAAQPEAAVEVKAPAGGWDSVPAPSVAKRHVGPKAAATPPAQ